MTRTTFIALALTATLAAAPRAANGMLDIYFIDTEGGQATLLVSPTGETFLIDAGFAGLDTPNPDKEPGRDAARIADVARIAAVKQIDTLLVTHFHGDHASGVAHLTKRLPVRLFLDHGTATQDVPPMQQKVGGYAAEWAAAFANAQHRVVAPGDRIAVRDLDVTVVQARGRSIDRAGAVNPHCQGVEHRAADNPENTASVGVVVQYGQFRFANFGDLPWNEELQLLCPMNRVGTIDVYQAARHGNEPSPAVYAMAPRAVVYPNGARKGGGRATLQAFRASPGIEDIWQLHKNIPGGAEGNPPDEFSANLQDTDQTSHPAHYLRITAKNDGSFTLYNSRTKITKEYGPRRDATGVQEQQAAEPVRPTMIAGCPADPVPFYTCAKGKMKTFSPPRTADGRPNFQGFWNANRQAFNIEAHEPSFAYQGGPTLVVDPAEGRVPYQPWAAAIKQERAAKTLDPPSLEFLDPNARCFLRGVPRQMWMMDYQFVQPAGSPFLFTLHEQNHAYRVIAMDGRPHVGSGITSWMGDSRGRWEGDTLVIETTNQNGRQWLDNVGNFYSDRARIVERIAMVDQNTLLWEARIEDPTVYTRPWTMTFPLRRNTTPGFQLMEFACHEGNKSPGLQLRAAPGSR